MAGIAVRKQHKPRHNRARTPPACGCCESTRARAACEGAPRGEGGVGVGKGGPGPVSHSIQHLAVYILSLLARPQAG